MAAPAPEAKKGPRPGNKRPALVAPGLQTLFALPPSRLWQHLRWPLKRLWIGSRLYDLTLGRDSGGEFRVPAPESWAGDVESGLRLLEGEFRFAGQSVFNPVRLRAPVLAADKASAQPGPAAPDAAWHEALAGFSWLDDLKVVGSPAARQLAKDLTARWLDEYPRYHPLGWRADLLASRLRHIFLNHAFLEIRGDAAYRARILGAIKRQARHLGRVLPELLFGADLLLAAISLMIAGLMLPSGDRLFARGRALFKRELARQILSDGGHIERSPRRMLDVLQHLVDLRDIVEAARQPLPDDLVIAIDHLAAALDLLRHDDGSLAAFNDTWPIDANLVDRAIQRAAESPRLVNSLPSSGFQRLEAGASVVIVDAGAPPPHGYDAHAHAGTLSFEMSHDGECLIVNCGAHPWSAAWREVQRTTAAHSTIIVDNLNSAILLPQKMPPRGLVFGLALPPRQIACRREEQDGQTWLDCAQDGYRESFGLEHRRRLYLAADGATFMGEDHLIGPGGNAFALRFHLHPDIQASVTQDGSAALLRSPKDIQKGACWRLRVSGGSLGLAESAYSAPGGIIRRSQQLAIVGPIESDHTELRWVFQREERSRR